MRKGKTTGPARMKELGKKKIEVWLSEFQWKEFKKVADDLGLPLASLARRACNQVGRSGSTWARILCESRYE